MDFRKAHFYGPLNSRNADFAGEVLFSRATFDDKADFRGVHFRGRATFNGATFAGRTTFSGSRFDANTTFHGCNFRRLATWRDCRFQRPMVLQSNTFNEDVDFGHAVFREGVDFQKTPFHERAGFEETQLTGEVVLSDVHAKHLKIFNATGARLDGIVLESAELSDNNRIEGFSLRGAALLALSLAREEVVNCDFTGAAFKAVLTQGWGGIVELQRLDQPIKAHIQQHDLHGSQVWCTSAFRSAVAETLKYLTFRKLNPFVLDKGHASSGDYHSIER